MSKYVHAFSEGWEGTWQMNLAVRQMTHMPSGLLVELRHSDNGIWYPFALNGEEWVAEDPLRLEHFTPLMLQAYTLFRGNLPETGWLPHRSTERAQGAA